MAVKRYNGTSWIVEAGSQGITYSATAPTTPAQGDIWVSTADISTFDSLVQTGNRNLLINGAFKIDQRNSGTSQTFTAAAALAYSVDRWYGYCTGANITGARVAGTAPDQYYYRFTGAASNTAVGFGQRIEAASSYHLAGQTATLAVSLASTSITTLTWTAYYATTADTFGTLASPTRTQIATGTFTINSTLTRYSANISVPAAATTGIEIVFTCGALLATQTLTYSNAQLEAGSAATPFEFRPYGTELALCQRYFERQNSLNVSKRYGMGYAYSTTAVIGVLYYQPKRTTPSSITNGGTLQVTNNTTTVYTTASAIGVAGADTSSSRFTISGFTGLTQGYPVILENTSNSYIDIDAEL